jgi:quercetin dioxygenase-like cupin family protein
MYSCIRWRVAASGRRPKHGTHVLVQVLGVVGGCSQIRPPIGPSQTSGRRAIAHRAAVWMPVRLPGSNHDNTVTQGYGRVRVERRGSRWKQPDGQWTGAVAHRPERRSAHTEETKMNHRIPSSMFVLATALCMAPAGTFAADAAPIGEATMITPDQLKWGDAPPSLPKGAKLAVLHGDPGKDGTFVIRLKLPANYKIAPHTHPGAYSVTVLSGTPSVGMGEKVDAKAAHALKAGSFHYLPAKTSHYWLVKGPTEIEVQGAGPFAVTYVNPDDDPEKKAAKK